MSAQIQMVVYHASQYFPTFEGFVERHERIVDLCRGDDVNECTHYVKKHILDGGQQLINALRDTRSDAIQSGQ